MTIFFLKPQTLKNIYKNWFICTALVFQFHLTALPEVQAQVPEIVEAEKKAPKKFYQTRTFKALIVPVPVIAYGISNIHGHGIPSSFWIYKEVHEHLNIKRSHVDDYLQYAGYAGLVGLNILKIKSESDLLNTSILTLKSVALNTALVFALKNITHITRPDSARPAEHNSFPSGHTANAFAAATLVHKEFGGTSTWYSVAAYTSATAVGVFRILNNRHWFADVVSGAGFGILSVNLCYLTHRYRWGRKPGWMIAPVIGSGMAGFHLQYRL